MFKTTQINHEKRFGFSIAISPELKPSIGLKVQVKN